MSCPYQALPHTVLVLDDRGPSQLASGLVLPDTAKRVMGSVGPIVSVGIGVKDFKEDQYIVYRKYRSKIIEETNGDRYAVVDEGDILCIVDPTSVDRIDVTDFKTNDLDVWKSELAMENRARLQQKAADARERMKEHALARMLDGR